MSSKQILINEMVDPDTVEEIPESVKEFYNSVSKSMLKQIRSHGIRKFSQNQIDNWLRRNFSINEDQHLVEKHKLAASQVSKFLLKTTNDYKIPLHEIRDLLEVDQLIQTTQKLEKEKFLKLKAEVEFLREQKRKLRKPRSKIKTRNIKTNTNLSSPIANKTIILDKSITIDYDSIYKPWMNHVETKSTSKSYWYIHEYIGRYIINFAIKKHATSINKEIVQAFLDDYGKGKAAKTMNHYNRVAKYFLEFCLKL